MDPDALLLDLRIAILRREKAERLGDYTHLYQHDEDIADYAIELLRWIDKGGFLPKEWQNKA